MLTPEMQKQLLTIARGALEARVRRTRPASPAKRDDATQLRSGAFVTIFCNGELRGCLGRVTPNRPLPELIDHLAREVADSDPRFEPVQPGELPDISVEVSVLTPQREIASVDEIDIGRHGLIIEQGSHRGLLLPQVPTQHEWNRETFVAQTCLKAGLPADAWRRGARMFVFEAQVFGEEDEGFIRG
jgi:AmmeMemoRadiSam system protein A